MPKTKFKLSALISLFLCVAVCITAALSLLFSDNLTAKAYSAEQDATVNEIWQGETKSFNGENLKSLYGQLVSGATKLDDVAKTATYNGTPVASKNIVIKFGGKVWVAVYLSKADTAHKDDIDTAPSGDGLGIAGKDDIVLTLWLAYSSDTAKWNESYNSTVGTYPSNMYGTSYMRSQVLNNGGEYWKDISTLQDGAKSDSNPYGYSPFTTVKPDTPDIADYLVAPRYIDWQYSQSSKTSAGYSYDLNNDAWGTDVKSNFYQSTYYRGKPGYTAWKDDLLWLPSLAETGYGTSGNQGLWQTTLEQRQNSAAAWLRSGHTGNVNHAWYLSTSGSLNYGGVSTEYVVRPALHLNLTKAAGAVGAVLPKASESEKVYSGEEQQFVFESFKRSNTALVSAQKDGAGDLKSSFDEETGVFKATDVGTYTLKFKPTGELEWNVGGGTEERTVTVTVTKAKIGEHFGADGKFSQTQEYVYHADEHKYELKLPDVTDGTFPLSLAGKSALSAGDITLTYIIDTHEESGHDAKKAEIESKIEKANDGDPSELNAMGSWTAYSKGGKCGDIDFDVNKPLGYCVIFRAEDPKGNHETLYGYFSVHIYNEKLTIYLKENFDTPPEVEYGDVSHTQAGLLGEVLKKIDKIEAANADGSVTDKNGLKEKLESEAESGKFRFYFQDRESGGTRYEIEATDGGKRLSAGKTYYLFLEYIDEQVTEADRKNYITFEWKLPNGEQKRPSFTVVKRKITVTLSAAGHTYGDTGLESKLTATPSRSDGKNWYGAEADRDLSKLITYKFSTVGGKAYTSLQSDMPAGTYNITAECANANYDVEFKGDTTYTVSKADNGWIRGPQISGWTYGGAAGAPAAEAKFGEVKFTYSSTESGEYSAIKPANAGEYYMKAEVEGSDNYTALTYGPIKFTIAKGSYNMSGISFTDKEFTYDGAAHSITISGTLPDGVSVIYEGNGQIGVGSYTVTAIFVGDSQNYNEIGPITATLRIVEASALPNGTGGGENPQSPDGKDGIPWWVWLVVGVGAALIIVAIIVAIIAIKRKKPQVIREVNADKDGFYDDADDK